tara:strand:- start:463 stop:891 length:429 start_codon:yes stop_codon:yes gene_type:complete
MPLPGIAATEDVLTMTLPDAVVGMTMNELEALPVTEFETSTIWTDGPQVFRGVRMVDLLAHFGIEGGTLKLTAANDYSIEVPVDSFTDDGAILAYQRNGQTMTLRTKGPLWVVYPYDSSPKFQSEVIYSNSIWQLDRMSAIE